MDPGVYLPFLQRLLELLTGVVLPDPGGHDPVVLHIVNKFSPADIGLHHAEGDVLHGLEVLIGQTALPFGCDDAEGVAAGEVRVLIALGPGGGVLGAAHQIDLAL